MREGRWRRSGLRSLSFPRAGRSPKLAAFAYFRMSTGHAHAFVTASSPLHNRIAFLHPVGAEILRDIKHLELGEAEIGQRAPGGGDVGAMVPGAAAAIDDDLLALV